jgi:SAM-dependent methyltransferase
MDPTAMEPYGLAMQAFFDGDANAQLIVRRDDGQEIPLPVAYFFRDPREESPVDQAALANCRGRVLDVGAGSGLHSLVLQERGLTVTAIDISPEAVEIMKKRGVADACCVDVFDFRGGPFDTILMMCHGIGIAGTIAGLDRFLAHARVLLSDSGCVLLDSLDARVSTDPRNVAYLDGNRKAGRYFGEIRTQCEFQGLAGPYYDWLHVDPDTLTDRAEVAGWRCEIIRREETGDYLAKLVLDSGSPAGNRV